MIYQHDIHSGEVMTDGIRFDWQVRAPERLVEYFPGEIRASLNTKLTRASHAVAFALDGLDEGQEITDLTVSALESSGIGYGAYEVIGLVEEAAIKGVADIIITNLEGEI